MKLPFSVILGLVLKPHFKSTKLFCKNPTFYICIPYTYVYSTLGLFVNIHHLKKHLGEIPSADENKLDRNAMLVHDLKIIATSLGLIQYVCLLVGCLTENPSLFLPHLAGQMVVISVRLFNAILLVANINLKTLGRLQHKLTAIVLMTFNWLQDYISIQYLPFIYIECSMDSDSNKFFLESIRIKHENAVNSVNVESSESVRVKLRALLVGLLGVSMSACAFASQPVELELDDDDVTQRLNNVSFARRLTKPTIRLVMGYGKLSAFVTGSTSLLLLIAVMSKQSWWNRGARWLAAPALLVAALETASDASDALLAAVLRGSAEPVLVAAQTVAACFLITVEILVWYFIAKFFEYNPPPLPTDLKDSSNKDPIIPLPQ